MNSRLERKKEFIRALAEFIAADPAAKSIALELEAKRPPLPGMPRWAHEWQKIGLLSPIRGYATVEEAVKALEVFLL